MKKFLFVQDKAPHGSIFGQEGLDAILMGSAFVECTVLLLEDGLYQVLSDQKTPSQKTPSQKTPSQKTPSQKTPSLDIKGIKDYSVTYQALSDYGVQNIFCSASHLERRGLDTGDFLVPVQILSDDEITALFNEHDVILSF